MASIIEQLDLDLCRKILLRTEEVMASNRPKGPSNYEYEIRTVSYPASIIG